MPLETFEHIDDLVVTNPAASDGLSQADDHIRGIKSTLKTDFPNITGPVTATQGELNELDTGTVTHADGTETAPSMTFDTEAGLGIYKVSAGKMGVSQGKRFVGNGLIPVGSLHSFPKLPAAGTYATGGGSQTNPERIEYIENDGSTNYLIAEFPDLAAYLGTTYGGNGITTFGVPNEKDTGRFRRSRTASVAVGTYQSSQNKAHTHSVTGTAAGAGAHTHTGTTSTDGAHQHDTASTAAGNFTAGSGTGFRTPATGDLTGSAGAHSHTFTTASVGAHAHDVSGTAASDGGTEARPEAFVVFACIKT